MTINKKLLKAQQYLRDGYYLKAIEILDKYLKILPTDLSGLMLRGEAFLRNEQFELALIDYAKVVELDDKNILALNNFSLALIRCNKPHEAKEIILYIHELDPHNFGGFINLGKIHQTLGEYQDAVNSAMRAIQIDPKSSLAYLNLGTAIGALGHTESAKQAFLMSNFLDPTNISAKINIAQVEDKAGNYSEAMLMYENILTLKNITPLESDLVKYYLSYSYLFIGQLEKGWFLYEYGFSDLLPHGSIRSSRKFIQPKWNGENISGKKLLIWREQGLGDEILFSTCLLDVETLGLDVILECEPRLIEAYRRTFPNWQIRPEFVGVDNYSLNNDFDMHCPLGSLPRLFRNNIDNFKNKISLFSASPYLKEKFAELIKPYTNKILVGISWRGGMLTALRNDNYTSILDWEEILKLPNCKFVNLQYGDCDNELLEAEKLFNIQILRWTDLDLKNDLESVMGLVSNLNHVVSVGTAISTIAPALGVHTILLTRPSWLMLGKKDLFPWFDCVTPLVTQEGEIVASKLKLVPDLLMSK
jgi:tetratricopeptide (TPR) repeat protein